MRAVVTMLAAWVAGLAGCLDSGAVVCGDTLCPAGTTCAADGSCVESDRFAACIGLADGATCSFSGLSGICRDHACEPLECGDGLIAAPEQCEGPNLGGATCLTYGFYEPDGLACTATCQVDTSACQGACGDGVVNGPELCDTVPGDALSCFEVGFDYGSVTCSDALCAPLYAGCARIGWTEHEHMGDYPQELWSPQPGEVFLPDGPSYLHVRGSASTDVRVPAGCSPSAIWSAPSGEVFVAGGFPSTLCRNDNGTWTTWDVPGGAAVYDLWGTATTDVYAAGDGMFHFDGTSWTELDIGAPSGTRFYRLEGRLGGVMAAGTAAGELAIFDGTTWSWDTVDAGVPIGWLWVSPTNAVYVNAGQGLYRKVGAGWQTFAPASAQSISGVWGVSDRAIYAFGRDAATFTDSVWAFDGAAWIPVDIPTEPVMIGGSPSSVDIVQIYDSYFESNGYLWSTAVTQASGEILAIWAFAADDVVAVTYGTMYRYDGTAWNETVLPRDGAVAIWGAAPNHVFVVGANGQLLDHDGAIWHDRSHPTDGVNLQAVAGEAADRVFAAGVGSGGGGVIYGFDGNAWTPVLTLAGSTALNAIWSSPTEGSYAIGTYTGSMYHHAPSDPPTTWTTIALPDTYPIGVWGDAAGVIVTFGDRRVVRLEPDGTFTDVQIGSPYTPTNLIGATDDVFARSSNDLIRYDGYRWDRVRVPTSFPVGISAVFAGNGTVVLGDGGGRITQLIRPPL